MNKGAKVKTALLMCNCRNIKCSDKCPYYKDMHCKDTMNRELKEYIDFLEARLIKFASACTSKGFLTTEEQIKVFNE